MQVTGRFGGGSGVLTGAWPPWPLQSWFAGHVSLLVKEGVSTGNQEGASAPLLRLTAKVPMQVPARSCGGTGLVKPPEGTQV